MTKRRILLTLFSAPLIFWAISALVVFAASEVGGCKIHEGYANACTVIGYDFGELLYSLGIFAAWGLLLVPILWGYMIVGWGAYEIVAYISRRLKRK
ncbi:hypothetical protein [Pseudovibrio sp. Tun.PSC04-5.I4]|uniref:hypothetical protein n=1 Tax=Pseudovibrio sp. Tun.PSC04-5.I4 TaxID=1798213 RepID=UPI00088D4427|nr:hypothetical protein [Pseudovibrio sp. Tun.PSC04-5.I4]SDR03836.1 hypothetical protein SAMN04515695_2443 [Pseudovibrio sp. Tun.PSC04-5.I4]